VSGREQSNAGSRESRESGRELRGAVIGLGAMGRHHARIMASLPGATLVACCDADEARAAEHARLHGAAALRAPEELPDDLDIAVVSTPTSSHRSIAEPLLRRGVACLVEKPLAGSLEDADAMIAAAREGGAVLHVGHAERFNPVMLAVRDLLRAPLFVEGHRLGGFPDRSLDVDVVLDLMIHDLDLLLWLAGGDVVEAHAIGVGVLTDKVDIANARVLLSGGCTANLTASRVSAEATRKLRFFQQDLYVSVDLRERVAEIVRVERAGTKPQIVREKTEPPQDAHEPLRLEQEALIAARAGELSSGVTGDEGRRALGAALRVLDAMAAHAARVEASRST
jgi:predicted dehydrogenase